MYDLYHRLQKQKLALNREKTAIAAIRQAIAEKEKKTKNLTTKPTMLQKNKSKAEGIRGILKNILRNQIELEEGLLDVIEVGLEKSKKLEHYVEDLMI